MSGTTSATLQIVEGGTTSTLKLDPTVSYTSDTFTLVSDGGVGTDVVVTDPPLGNSVFTLLSVGDFGTGVVTDPPLASSASAAVSPQDLLYSGGMKADTPASALSGNGALQGGQGGQAWPTSLAALGIGDFSGEILFRENTGGAGSNQFNGNGALKNGLQAIGDASGIVGEHLGKADSGLLFHGDKPGAVGVGAISGDEKLHGSSDIGDSSTIYKVVR